MIASIYIYIYIYISVARAYMSKLFVGFVCIFRILTGVQGVNMCLDMCAGLGVVV